MNQFRVPILALFLSVVCILDAPAEDSVFLAAQETEAIVEPRSSQQRLVRLPTMSFELRVAIECPGKAESLTLSVSDTFETFNNEDLGMRRFTETSLRVPANQLTLAGSDHFCIKDDDGETVDELVVPGFLTAFASLRCAGQDGPSIHFASAPLQVRLHCERELPGETQESSLDK